VGLARRRRKPYTKTPIFRADMRYIVLNPTWTVPPGIMKKEVAPGMRRDPGYLQKKGYVMVNGQVVQPAGPKNALGRVKLIFPNPHHVYLHDTPRSRTSTRRAAPSATGVCGSRSRSSSPPSRSTIPPGRRRRSPTRPRPGRRARSSSEAAARPHPLLDGRGDAGRTRPVPARRLRARSGHHAARSARRFSFRKRPVVGRRRPRPLRRRRTGRGDE
jgi:hypothetical protein